MRLLIIGGSDAGISAALRTRELRPEIEVTVVLADAFPNYSVCGLPFFISGETPDWRQLAHRTQFPGIELLCNRFAESVDCGKKTVSTRTSDGVAQNLAYDKLIIATGAKPMISGIPGVEHVHPLHTMTDSFRVHEKVASGAVRRAAVVGVGYIGIEMADALTHRGVEVELVGRSRSVLPAVDPGLGGLVRKRLEGRNVRVHTGVEIDRVQRTDSGLALAGTADFATTVDMVVWATGVVPLADLARSAGIDTGIRGAYKVTRRMETNQRGVYAAGDCVETWHRVLQNYTWLPLGTTAHKQGRVAGENAVGGDVEFAGVVGTQVVKLFDLAIARTGLLDHEARRAGFTPLTTQAELYDHKAYYPGAEKLHFRVTGDAPTGRLLGAQIAGNWKAEVAKRVDVFATALYHQMKVDEISALDLSYTPPLGSPWDAVQLAGQAWTAEQRTNNRQMEMAAK